MVTIFYVATLVGKIISLVSTPLNSVIIGHLSKYEGGINSKKFRLLCLCSVPVALLLSVLCTVISYVFVGIVYPQLYDAVTPYLWVANLGQVLFFVSGILIVILIRCSEYSEKDNENENTTKYKIPVVNQYDLFCDIFVRGCSIHNKMGYLGHCMGNYHRKPVPDYIDFGIGRERNCKKQQKG